MSAAALAATARPGSPLAGLGTLARLVVRRDRLWTPLWVAALAGLGTMVAGSLVRLYPTEQDWLGYAVTLDNPGSTFMIGPVYSAERYDWGVMTGHDMMVILGIGFALLGALTVIRHTRAEEETGRAELARSAVLGRWASLAVGVGAGAIAVLLAGAALAGGLAALRVAEIDGRGTLVFAAALVAFGWVFVGVGAVAAQLARSARGAGGLAAAVLGGSFVIRSMVDVSAPEYWWVTPFGWSQRTQPWFEDWIAPLGLSLAAAAILLGVAAMLSSRRDLGAGLLAERLGGPDASRGLATPVGLALRLNRGLLLGWGIGLLGFGVAYGPVLADAEQFLSDIPVLTEFMPEATGAGGTRLFAAIIVALGAIAATIPALQIVARLSADEAAGRLGPFLTVVSRVRWYGATVAVALGGLTLLLAVFGLAFGLGASSAVDDPALLGDLVVAALAYLPAAAVVVGLAALLVGWAPRAFPAAWVLLGFSFVVLYFASLLDWPEAVRWFSPFDHVSQRPAVESGDGAALAVLAVLAVVLAVVGAVGYRRRDLR